MPVKISVSFFARVVCASGISSKLYGYSWVICFLTASADLVEGVSPLEQEAIIKAVAMMITRCFMCIPSMSRRLKCATCISLLLSDLITTKSLDNKGGQYDMRAPLFEFLNYGIGLWQSVCIG